MSTKHIDFAVNSTDLAGLAAAAKHLVRQCDLFDRDDDSISYKLFTDGLSNKLIGLFRGEFNYMSDRVIMVRIDGETTTQLVDRVQELTTIKMLSENGFGAKLIATFNNGIVYNYLPGRPTN